MKEILGFCSLLVLPLVTIAVENGPADSDA